MSGKMPTQAGNMPGPKEVRARMITSGENPFRRLSETVERTD